ncbi:hypothetical protein C8Q80DRAFT_419746 [Daedaleopsis nitida]|nr:hypothetical protein C8Q80DRAFT_419746 [Daedaleopsis nitida]
MVLPRPGTTPTAKLPRPPGRRAMSSEAPPASIPSASLLLLKDLNSRARRASSSFSLSPAVSAPSLPTSRRPGQTQGTGVWGRSIARSEPASQPHASASRIQFPASAPADLRVSSRARAHPARWTLDDDRCSVRRVRTARLRSWTSSTSIVTRSRLPVGGGHAAGEGEGTRPRSPRLPVRLLSPGQSQCTYRRARSLHGGRDAEVATLQAEPSNSSAKLHSESSSRSSVEVRES